MSYNDYVMKVFGSANGALKWSRHGLYDPASNDGPYKYNNKIYRMEYVLDFVPDASSLGAKALDLGCGGGVFIPALVRKGYSVTGMDIAEEMIIMSRELCDNLGLKPELSVGDCNKTCLPDNSMDVCICVGLVEHQQTDEPLLKEVNRVLKPGGLLVITLRNYLCPFVRGRQFYESTKNNILRKILKPGAGDAQEGVYESREHAPFAFKSKLRRFGYEVVGQRYSHFYFLPHPVIDFLPRINTRISKSLECLSRTMLGFLGSTCIISARTIQ
jgi:ubiquinone/menaquinone biosynthesis C-methylase UbiE